MVYIETDEEYVEYKTAKLAKEKGFNKAVQYVYGGQAIPQKEPFNELTFKIYPHLTLAPTQTSLQKWLREEHQIHVQCYLFKIKNKTYRSKITYFNNGEHNIYCSPLNDYEKALEEGLITALTLIK